jgi:broad specificity phosphatase PhoE
MASPATVPRVQRVYIMRHAERSDEADRHWRPKHGASFDDPELTARGHEQSAAAAEQLRSVHAQTPFRHIASSPFLRCVQTAAHVSTKLGLPLQRLRGLAQCAAAAEIRGLEAPLFVEDRKLVQKHFLTPQNLEPEFLDCDQTIEDFVTAVLRYSAAVYEESRGASPALICSHREGVYRIRQQLRQPVKPRRQGYAEVAVFDIDLDTNTWAEVAADASNDDKIGTAAVA